MIERGHKPVVDALSKLCQGDFSKWTKYLHLVLWADRVTVRRSTGFTPYSLVYGADPLLPIELSVPTWSVLPWDSVQSTSDLLAIRARQLERREDDLEEARQRLRRTRNANKDYFDARHATTNRQFSVDDLVLL